MQAINECDVKLNDIFRIHICTCILIEDHLTSILRKMGKIVNRSKTVDGKGGLKGVNRLQVKDNLILTYLLRFKQLKWFFLIVLHVPVIFYREN